MVRWMKVASVPMVSSVSVVAPLENAVREHNAVITVVGAIVREAEGLHQKTVMVETTTVMV
jgi:hypothetical protein